jgi:hypothetical protein
MYASTWRQSPGADTTDYTRRKHVKNAAGEGRGRCPYRFDADSRHDGTDRRSQGPVGAPFVIPNPNAYP